MSLAALDSVLYTGLGLPIPKNGEKIPSDYNALTSKINGNTDSNHDGKIDKNDKNDYVEIEELIEEVFSHREKYKDVIKNLREIGFEDPFEIYPRAAQHVERLLKIYRPANDYEKALLLFKSILPSGYDGLPSALGGLEVQLNLTDMAPLRKKHGSILPKEIMSAKEKTALCLEYSFLLAVFLRIAGIRAHLGESPGHAYVIAILDGKKYRLDITEDFVIKRNIPPLKRNRNYSIYKVKDNPVNDRVAIAMHYSNEGATYGRQGKLNKALRSFDIALKLNPHSLIALNYKAIILMRQRKLDKALECLNTALRIDPDNAKILQNKGLVLERQGRLREAVSFYDKSLEIEPHNALALNNKGNALKKLGKLDFARRCFDRAIKIQPDYIPTWNNKGLLLAKMEKFKEALKCYDRAINLQPGSAIVWNNKGLLLAKQGRYTDAVRCYKKAISLRPHYALAWFNLGSLFLFQNQLKKALPAFNEAVNLNPNFTEAWDAKARTLYKQGRGKEAFKCWDKILEIWGIPVNPPPSASTHQYTRQP